MRHVLLAACLALASCGPATRGQGDVSFPTIGLAGQHNQVVLHYDSRLTQVEKAACDAAAYYHVDAFENRIFPVVQSAVGAVLPTPGPKHVWVYDQHHLNAPYANTVNGWIDYDNSNAVHIVAGPGQILPDLMGYLTRAYYPNVPPYTVSFPGLVPPTMSYPTYVDSVNAEIMRLLKFLRNVP